MKVVVIDIPTLPGYGITSCGKVFRYPYIKSSYRGDYLTKLRQISVNLNAEYPQLEVHLAGKRKTVKLHRLLAETFIPNPENLPQVNHKDGNKFNHNLENLEWVSASDNVRHSYELGLASNRGSRHPRNILNEELVAGIKALMQLYPVSNKKLAEKFGVHDSTISKIRSGKLWGHVNP